MSNSFFNLPLEERLMLIVRTADQRDVSDLIIEKDLWVCWVLQQLFSLPIPMAFKGGTSLSKVFNLIKRFSEDCDITIDYRHFIQAIDLEKISRSQLKKVSDQLKKQLQTYVLETILPYLQSQVSQLFPNQLFEITLSEDGEQLRFYYPSIINISRGYLRDHVLIEFGIRNSTEPCEKHAILPYLTDNVDKNIDLPKPIIDTLSPIRTFWEKVTLIHVECHRERLVNTPERASRHWYDLYMLYNSWVGEQAILRNDILKSVLDYKTAFFNASYANYEDCWNGKLRLLPSPENQSILALDFAHMIDAAMFYEEPPLFVEIIESLKNLETKINNIQHDFYIGKDMLNIQVIYFLSEQGKEIFPVWFDKVTKLTSQQDGFVWIEYKINKDGDPIVFLHFENQEKLNRWADSEVHNALVLEIENYYTQPELVTLV